MLNHIIELTNLLSFKNSIPTMDCHKWIGPKPSRILWERMHKTKAIKIDGEYILCVLDYYTIKSIKPTYLPSLVYKNQRLYLKRGTHQLIGKNSEYENRLLELSSIKSKPHEIKQVRVITIQGETFTSKIEHGKKSSVSNLSKITKEIHKQISLAKRSGFTISQVQLNHTHPSLELIMIHSKGIKAIFNCLSETDLNTALKISEFVEWPLTVRAITPNGINYSATF